MKINPSITLSEFVSALRNGVDDLLSEGDPATDCWIWQGELNRNGYGTPRIKGRRKMVHRIVYEALVDPIPPGLLLDRLPK